ncbi:MAG: NACHT domain-containing protein [Cyanobacteriota bacterium]|nr:NACHT domain-containing protein [Cyanobacteriota bacterium]
MAALNQKKRSKNRQKLLEAMDGELQQLRSQSLNRAVAVYLTTEKPSERLIRSWEIVVKVGDRPKIQLPDKVSIIQVFDRLRGKLLILGNPGSGKTTTLLELASCLLIRAKKNPEEPMPILLNLSTWKPDYSNFVAWLIDRLQQEYKIPRVIGNYWLENQQLLPLLDGLDEVNSRWQEQCLQDINQLVENFPPKHLVVSSSLAAYKKCPSKLKLNAAVILQPVTHSKIQEYTFAARSRELWYNIKEEPELLKLAGRPLFLSMMTLAYEEILIESWRRITGAEDKERYVLNAYVRRQLGRDIKDGNYSKNKQPLPEETKRWLAWLAGRMEERGEREFRINKLQESWLTTKEERWTYGLGVRLLSQLILALILGRIFGLIFGWIGGAIAALIGVIIGTFVAIPGLKRLMLRVVLCCYGNIPWNYSRFLDYATERLFLQKVGDRYQFIHEILQKHFACMR